MSIYFFYRKQIARQYSWSTLEIYFLTSSLITMQNLVVVTGLKNLGDAIAGAPPL